MADTIHHNFFAEIMNKTMDLANGDDCKIALFTSAWTIDPDQTTYSSTSECASTGSYATGGITLNKASMTVTDSAADNCAYWDSSEDPTWASSTITARYAQIYNSTVTNKVICAFDFTTDKSSSSGTFKIVFNASGILKIA